MAIFKYFTEERHALALMNKGKLMLQPLSYFRAIETVGVRGDPRDGILTYAPQDGLELNMQDGRTIVMEGGSFNASVSQHDIFVYCASNQLSAILAEKFGAFCVEIPEPNELIRRLRARNHQGSRFDYEQLVFGKVDYREHSRIPEADWALPEKLVLIKPSSFAWQDEFRIAVGKRSAMNVGNVTTTIQTGQSTDMIEGVPAPIFLKLNKLTDAILHRF